MIKVLLCLVSVLVVVSAQSCVDLDKLLVEFDVIQRNCFNQSSGNESDYDEVQIPKMIECALNERKLLDDGPLTWEKLSKQMECFIPANTTTMVKEDLLKKIKEVWDQHKDNLRKFFEEMWPVVMQSCPDDFKRVGLLSDEETTTTQF